MWILLAEDGAKLRNCLTHCVRRGDIEIQLTSREFQLLDLLIRNRERVMPREVQDVC